MAVVVRGVRAVRPGLVVRRRLAAARRLLFATTARRAALAAGRARFLAGPLVGGSLLVCRPAALAGDLALFVSIHRGKTAILFRHDYLPGFLRNAGWPDSTNESRRIFTTPVAPAGCNGCATDQSRKSLPYLDLAEIRRLG